MIAGVLVDSIFMDLRQVFINIAASSAIIVRRFILLIFSPYKTMRKISEENDYLQIVIILTSVSVYFQFASRVRGVVALDLVTPFFFFLGFFGMIFFFFAISHIWDRKFKLKTFLFTFTYTLLPTLLWFVTNSALYRLLPPPRTMSVWGKAFSIFFISYSVSLLLWKVILFYLAVRFATKFNFPRIIFLIILYTTLFIPYTLCMYFLKIFRVPFI